MNAPPVRIREAVDSDAEEISGVVRRAFESQCRLYDDWSLPPMSETADDVRAAISAGVVLVADIDGRIVGSVRAIETCGSVEVGRLVVEPTLQGSGIGRRLAEELESRFPDARRFEIFTGHRSAGPLHLYEGLGYRRYKETTVHDGLRLVFLEKRARPSADEEAD